MKTAYPNTTQPVSITLYSNIPFDNTYKNHSFISSYFKKQSGGSQPKIFPNGEQSNFLNRKNSTGAYIYKRWTFTDTFNFDFKNGLNATITLELLNEQTNANYLMVVCGTQKWFYFITSIMQSNIDTYTLQLELDVLMTYGDDFLEGVKDVPVFAKRKHCKRYSGLLMFSHDYKNGESAYEGVKPNLLTHVYPLENEYREYPYGDDYSSIFSDVLWAYITTDLVDSSVLGVDALQYRINECANPFSVLCIPINYTLNIRVHYEGTEYRSYSIGGRRFISKLVSQEHFKSAKILPFPPFHRLAQGITVSKSGYSITINGEHSDNLFINNEQGYGAITLTSSYGGKYYLRFGNNLGLNNNENALLENAFVVCEQYQMYYNYKPVSPYDLFKPNDMSILSSKVQDPKLKLKPFTKYCISSSGSEESEFYVELLVSYTPLSLGQQGLHFASLTTAYCGDYTIYTYLTPPASMSTYAFNNYKWGKVGLSQSTNYTLPVGTNALDVFKNTQYETFYQSKVASGITSGLTIAGGVASIGLGIAGAVGSMGMSTPASVGLIAGGATAIASGTAGISNTIKSANAKIEDLKNTPDSINLSGSSYAHDISMLINGLLPYINVYECSPVIMNGANEYFYSYGYEIARPCYFNQLVDGSQSSSQYYDDNDLFTRTIFNYIQLNEDITNKINADIPLIIKQKISSIFNQGITLWTFFGFSSLNSNTNETTTYSLDKWLYKNSLENKEYQGESYE